MSKKMMIKQSYLLLGMLMLILFLPSVLAITQPSQKFEKIFISPFYTSATTKDTITTFTMLVNPSDHIKSVTSAIVSFDVWLNPSVDFTLSVNNQSCRNPSYEVSTNFAMQGKNNIIFDCGNVITKAGIYTFKLTATKDTGAVTGWLDLSYINNPVGEMAVSGTEYTAGDLATIFVQLKDNQGLAINDGSCYLDVWQPSTTNATHSQIIKSAPMLKAEGNEGIYYYDMVAPSILGVYMLSARCSYSFSGTWVYSLDGTETNKPTRNITSGTYSGDTIFLNDFEDWVYTLCASGGGKICDAYNDFNLSIHYGTNFSDISNIDLFYMGESSLKNVISFSVWNWTSNSWIALSNNLTYSGLASSVPIGIGDFISNSIPIKDTISSSGIIRIRSYSIAGSGFSQYNNWLNIEVKKINGLIQDVKGSSEMHITNIPQATANLISNLTLNVNYSAISKNVWEYIDRNLTYTPDLTNYYLIQTLVWNATNRNLTYYQDVTNYSLLAGYVWNYENKNLTYYQMNNLTASDVWNYVNRNLTFYEDKTNYSQITQNVWGYDNRSLTYYQTNNLTANDIWNYYNRSLNLNVGQEVWGYYNKTLTYYPPTNNLTANDIWSYVNRSMTQDIPFEVWSYNNRELTENISFNVWNYANRSLTFYPEVDLSGVPSDVWNYATRNLTYYQDVTNYTHIGWSVWNWAGSISSSILSFFTNDIWNSAIRTLTFYEDTTNYSRVAEYVWQYNNRNLTFYEVNNISPEDIWQYTSRNLTFTEDVTNYSKNAEYVWLYVNRNLTTYPIGNNISVSDIWAYYNRSLSDDIPLQIWSYENRNLTIDIPFEVWNYQNRRLTYYTLNLTELIEMIGNYTYDQTFSSTNPLSDQYRSTTLNVILQIQK